MINFEYSSITPDSVKNRDTEDNGVQQAVQETESKDNSQEKEAVENIETKIDGIKEAESTTVEKSEVELLLISMVCLFN